MSGLVLIGMAATATGCAGKHSAGTTPTTPEARSYSVADVKRTFAAQGLPLMTVGQEGGVVVLMGSGDTGDFSVLVWPPMQVFGPLGVVVQLHQRLVRIGNIAVTYAPASASAIRVRAAIFRLRYG